VHPTSDAGLRELVKDIDGCIGELAGSYADFEEAAKLSPDQQIQAADRYQLAAALFLDAYNEYRYHRELVRIQEAIRVISILMSFRSDKPQGIPPELEIAYLIGEGVLRKATEQRSKMRGKDLVAEVAPDEPQCE
jgi:hypothetical protein